ncbi:hypothetical protein SS50377_24750 [Spironucleus salmonicida]|uniref:Uncharacterized protein n=1 Tax=Spironucleus salmonicida TaxID=348837 RepID=V6LJ41_9EUKA|nr:hypothetical protein SS50377_24750 [Spironucleus salmonicida]|eukprot:EST44630.1 Hypothetical protein SS50377_15637 [Spironucleus salmonicida]
MIFYAYYSSFAMLQLNYHKTLTKYTKYNVSVPSDSINNFTSFVFGNDNVSNNSPITTPLVNGDIIYYFPMKNIRNTGIVVAANDIREIRYQIKGSKINLWTEDKSGKKYDFMVDSVVGIQLLEKCYRQFKQFEGIIFWCQKQDKSL